MGVRRFRGMVDARFRPGGGAPLRAEPTSVAIRIQPLDDSPGADQALEALLHESYIGGGFTDPEFAAMFRAPAVRSRGTVLVAVDERGTLLGTLTLVPHGSAASRLATTGEVEFHLLCVKPDMRGRGIGRALVESALEEAVNLGARGVVLWTQPAMVDAQRLYERSGFRRDARADFRRRNRQFLVYRRSLNESGM